MFGVIYLLSLCLYGIKIFSLKLNINLFIIEFTLTFLNRSIKESTFYSKTHLLKQCNIYMELKMSYSFTKPQFS